MKRVTFDKLVNYINYLKYKLWLNRAKRNDKFGGGAIVMFHHVRDDAGLGISDSCKVTSNEFLEFIDFISSKRIPVSIDAIIQNAKVDGLGKMVAVSFDDVPNNFYDVAYPILREKEIPFVLYIATGLMDTDGYLTSKQILELSKDALCTIGAHTVSHPMLKMKGVNLKKEFYDCQETLQKIIGKPVVHFAYPYGTPTAINTRVIKSIKKSGLYVSAVTTIPGYVNEKSLRNNFAIPRIQSKLYMSNYKNNN